MDPLQYLRATSSGRLQRQHGAEVGSFVPLPPVLAHSHGYLLLLAGSHPKRLAAIPCLVDHPRTSRTLFDSL